MRRWISCIVLAAGCPSVPQDGHTPMGHQDDCYAALAAFANADPNLKPLPAGCTVADAAKAMHAVGATSVGELGDPVDTFTVNFFTTPKLPEVHAWVDHTEHIVLVDVHYPPTPAAAYVHALGEPEARLDYAWKWEGSVLAHAELVWPSRGVIVASSPEDVNGVIRVGIFAPCTLAQYQKVRYFDREREEREE